MLSNKRVLTKCSSLHGISVTPVGASRSFASHHNPCFTGLVRDLSDMLKPYSGLDASEIDHIALQRRMEKYRSSSDEWNRYAHADFSKNYTRNLVDRGNGKSNLLLLVWTPGKGSPVHDHVDSHCVMKILQGTLQETLYDWPKSTTQSQRQPLRILQNRRFHTNEVTYMSDKLGLHKVGNPDPHRVAVSLHLYTPPWAEKRGCHMFEERTGKACHVVQSTHSEYGMKRL